MFRVFQTLNFRTTVTLSLYLHILRDFYQRLLHVNSEGWAQLKLGIRDTSSRSWLGNTPPRNKDVTGTAIKASTRSSAHLSMYETRGWDNGEMERRRARTPHCVNILNLARDCRSTKRAPIRLSLALPFPHLFTALVFVAYRRSFNIVQFDAPRM